MRLAPVSFKPPARLRGERRSTVQLIVLSPMKPGDNICRVLTLMFNLREAYGGRRAWV